MTSPIESALFDSLVRDLRDRGFGVKASATGENWKLFMDNGSVLPVHYIGLDDDDRRRPYAKEFLVVRQCRFLGYVIDILLIGPWGRWALAVECDGHEFHSTTKHQASSDRARDRELLLGGITTVRFTGSDIHRDSDACAKNAVDIIEHSAMQSAKWIDRLADYSAPEEHW